MAKITEVSFTMQRDGKFTRYKRYKTLRGAWRFIENGCQEFSDEICVGGCIVLDEWARIYYDTKEELLAKIPPAILQCRWFVTKTNLPIP